MSLLRSGAKVREKEGRQALGICRGLRLLRSVKLLLTSVQEVAGQSATVDGDVRMVRTAVELMERWAEEEGIRA